MRIAEVLDRLGLFVDDRTPAVDRWLERKLDGMPPGIHRAVEAWVRTLLDGGPRSEPRSRHTTWAYLGEIQPVLLEWSSRYDHLREVTREDIIAARDAVTGKQRRLRVDRQLEEALTHGADPLHLALVFGIDEKTAIRYADSARQLLQADLAADPACSPRTHGSTPDNGTRRPLGSR
ncbi:hypothetical protein ACFYWY_29110 [Streptomyces sp. NPDC002870]|uniref:hypothetical protein n=1 Tax=Streptomyces sp. NPDC002870 TaxID=3364666 RepID=UPI0036A9E8D0